MESQAQGSPWALQEPLVCNHLDPQNEKPNKSGEGNHWGLLPYDNIKRNHEMDETNSSIVRYFSKTGGGGLVYIYLYQKN